MELTKPISQLRQPQDGGPLFVHFACQKSRALTYSIFTTCFLDDCVAESSVHLGKIGQLLADRVERLHLLGCGLAQGAAASQS